ncbi:hypothetical protein [Mariniblastus fucicola]|uniref:Uncharacterized protein n=1 Tax=Mariniblastus fucicola TaxID=980251 RepID=A0A5B9PDX8_9BACT|nr:hypothetical protein [Mariniblastus fucicola]QEG23142.1 hypothetical protein MFFC18_30370 [Mariniblastus fucicola]
MSSRAIVRLAVILFLGVCIFIWQPVVPNAFAMQQESGLPTAEQVLDRHILAIGGYELLSSISSTHTVWRKSDPSGEWEFERWRVPGRFHSIRRSELSTTTYGCWVADRNLKSDSLSGVSWQVSRGRVTFHGGDALGESLIDAATIADVIQWQERYESIKCKGIVGVSGKRCHVLEFVDARQNTTTRCFDVETNFLIQKTGVEHRSGTRQVIRTYSKHKKYGDVVIPTRQIIESPSGTDVWTVTLFELDHQFDMDQHFVPDVARIAIDRMVAELKLTVGENVADRD